MQNPTDRKQTHRVFRQRLLSRMQDAELNRARLAKLSGVDRSTLSQLLSDDSYRLPRADTVAALALTLQVSVDWLLGLSTDDRRSAEIMTEAMEFTAASRTQLDKQLDIWYEEAVGRKIRYVPSSLPDQAKTDRILLHEFATTDLKTPEQAIGASHDRLRFTRLPEADVEVCTTMQSLHGFAAGTGIWQGLEPEARIEQLDKLINLLDELYPRFRLFLFDGLSQYSAPYTVFGLLRVAIFLGQMYLVFNTKEHVQQLTQHFDNLIKGASIHAHDVSNWLRELRTRVE